jgi:hypothetical protein
MHPTGAHHTHTHAHAGEIRRETNGARGKGMRTSEVDEVETRAVLDDIHDGLVADRQTAQRELLHGAEVLAKLEHGRLRDLTAVADVELGLEGERARA